MAIHNTLGEKGENHAKTFLIEQGYKILETNWRYHKKEIDIIALHTNTLVFIEVKTRSTNFFQLPQESVTKKKQAYLIEAANAYIQQIQEEYFSIQFDIIAIVINKELITTNHIKEAFYPLA